MGACLKNVQENVNAIGDLFSERKKVLSNLRDKLPETVTAIVKTNQEIIQPEIDKLREEITITHTKLTVVEKQIATNMFYQDMLRVLFAGELVALAGSGFLGGAAAAATSATSSVAATAAATSATAALEIPKIQSLMETHIKLTMLMGTTAGAGGLGMIQAFNAKFSEIIGLNNYFPAFTNLFSELGYKIGYNSESPYASNSQNLPDLLKALQQPQGGKRRTRRRNRKTMRRKSSQRKRKTLHRRNRKSFVRK